MVINTGPRPQQGRPSTVEIIDTSGNVIPLHVVDGSYQVQEAQRFGDKISTGDLSYGDFNPSEPAWVWTNFPAGYGLRRYADMPKSRNVDAYVYIKESLNVDCRHDIATLAPLIVLET